MLSATTHADPTAAASSKLSEMSIHSEYKVFLGLKDSIDQSDAEQAKKETEILTILFDLKFKIEFLNLFSLNENLKDLSHSGTYVLMRPTRVARNMNRAVPKLIINLFSI